MKLRIEFMQPIVTKAFFLWLWIAIIAGWIIFSIVQDRLGLSGWIPVLLMGLYWQLFQLKSLYRHRTGIVFDDQSWYLLIDGKKCAINILSSSVIWPLWIRLDYHPSTTNKPSSLLILKDSMSDKDYRHLSTALRFFDSSKAF